MTTQQGKVYSVDIGKSVPLNANIMIDFRISKGSIYF